MEDFTELERLLEEARGLGDRHYTKGVKKAATDTRKVLQTMRNLCKTMRDDLLESQKTMGTKKKKKKKVHESDVESDQELNDASDDQEPEPDSEPEPEPQVVSKKSRAKKPKSKAPVKSRKKGKGGK